MINNYEVFLFDFDGTLFDTLESSIYVFEEAYRRQGYKIRHEDILGYTREPIPNSYERVTGSLDGYDEFIKSIDELVFSQKVVDMAKMYEDTERTLKTLKEQNKIVGIVTSNAKEHVLDVLRKHKIEKYFDIIVGNREASTPKPSPLPILTALKTLNYTEKEKVVYIGDALNDALAAVNAGVKPVLLDRLQEFKELSEYKIIESLDEIVR